MRIRDEAEREALSNEANDLTRTQQVTRGDRDLPRFLDDGDVTLQLGRQFWVLGRRHEVHKCVRRSLPIRRDRNEKDAQRIVGAAQNIVGYLRAVPCEIVGHVNGQCCLGTPQGTLATRVPKSRELQWNRQVSPSEATVPEDSVRTRSKFSSIDCASSAIIGSSPGR